MNKSLFSSGTNTWETPIDFFNKLDAEFHFTLDPCCEPETAKCRKYYTKEDDGLSKDWTGEVVFCNPPYSNQEQTLWVKKCYEHGQNGGTAVMLIPARTDTKRFHQYILGKSEIRFIEGRLKFGGSSNSAPFPSMVVIFSPKTRTSCSFIAPNESTIHFYKIENDWCVSIADILPTLSRHDLSFFENNFPSLIKNNMYGIPRINDIGMYIMLYDNGNDDRREFRIWISKKIRFLREMEYSPKVINCKGE